MVKNIKHRARLLLMKNNNIFIYKVVSYLNLLIFHSSKRQVKKKFGNKNKDIHFFVIRSLGKEEGLLSLYKSTMRLIEYSDKKGYVPVIDMENYKTQYNESFLVNGTKNAWSYYFEQPSNYSLEEVYKSRNVTLSGWSIKKNYYNSIFNFDFSEELNIKRINFTNNKSGINEQVTTEVMKTKEKLFSGKTLGVYLRGTDYVALKPKGHPIQPEILDVINKTKEFVNKYEIEKIFLVTEDYEIYSKFTSEFGELVISSDDNYITNYDGEDYLVNYFDNSSNYERGLNYLIKMLLLSECEYLVSSITNGSLFSLTYNDNKYYDKYIFNLGYY